MAGPMMKKRRLGSAVYVLPNLITTGNLFFGYFSIIKSLQGDFKWAASAILLAAVFDMLDGRVARLTGGSSEFGVQYDSLCDLVSFGVAPAFLMYQYGLFELGRVGWVFAFFFLACGALRLARFNVMSAIGKSSGDFTGLPIPMAAVVIATFVAAGMEVQSKTGEIPRVLSVVFDIFTNPNIRLGFLAIACPSLSLLMVSNVTYRSHKKFKVSGIAPFKLLVIAVSVASITAYQPELVGFILCVTYALTGPLEWVLGWKKPIEDDEIFAPLDEDDSVLDPAYESDENRRGIGVRADDSITPKGIS
jgi:CDP-diacylglycerol---serine O-phosphatidyltransferase